MCHKVRTALIEDVNKLGGIVRSMKPMSAAKTATNIGTRKAAQEAVVMTG